MQASLRIARNGLGLVCLPWTGKRVPQRLTWPTVFVGCDPWPVGDGGHHGLLPPGKGHAQLPRQQGRPFPQPLSLGCPHPSKVSVPARQAEEYVGVAALGGCAVQVLT